MQELRIVLIIVGLLAIAALLFHGLWTNRKDSKASKFSDKPLGKLGEKSPSEPVRDSLLSPSEDGDDNPNRSEPEFSADVHGGDPLLGGYDIVDDDEDVGPVFRNDGLTGDDNAVRDLSKTIDEVEQNAGMTPAGAGEVASASESESAADEPDFEVIVLSVHCSGNQPFVGTQLFDSMKQNGLLYGPMDIFHRHADLSGTGKVLFSVANIMQPGTLQYDDPAEFTTKGISFFMTLPGFGDPEQNFKLMLKTAQQIADDLGGNVVDDRRNLMTPDRLNEYRRQIQQFKVRTE